MKNKEKYNLSELNITIENGLVIIENLNKRFNGLKEYCEWLEEEGDWKPKEGDYYYFISEDLQISETINIVSGYDYARIIKRNVYQTKLEALTALNMYKFCKERSFIPNWKNEYEARYHLVLHHNTGVANCYEDEYVQEFAPFYYPNEKVVYEIINEFSFEELEKYYGRV